MRKSTIYLYVLGIAVVITAALVSAGLVSAQNSNSSTTIQADNMNTAKPKPKSRRHKMKPKTTEAAADTGMAAEAMPPATPRRTGRCDPMQQEQTDLSGTYTGKLRHGDEEVRDATLTITGNNFTMTSGSDTHSGRITAVTTCGYTAVTVMHGGDMAAAPGATPGPNKAMSLRAKKMGDSLTLTSVPGEPEKVMFTSGGGAMRPRKHRTRKPAPPPPPTTPPEQ